MVGSLCKMMPVIHVAQLASTVTENTILKTRMAVEMATVIMV